MYTYLYTSSIYSKAVHPIQNNIFFIGKYLSFRMACLFFVSEIIFVGKKEGFFFSCHIFVNKDRHIKTMIKIQTVIIFDFNIF